MRLFGRRQDRPLKPRQARLMDELLPEVAVTPQTVAGMIEDWRAGTDQPLPRERSKSSIWGEGPSDVRSRPHASPAPSSDIEDVDLSRRRGEDERSESAPRSSSGAGSAAVAPEGDPPPARPEVWLEVGFGGGEHLAWQAARNPRTLMIGAEPFINGAAKLLSAIDERGLPNVRVRHGDARDLMAAIPDGGVDRAFVLHPDPWPKRRHWKRRIVSVPFLTEMHRICAPGAELRIASDIPDYVRWTLVMRDLAERGGARWDWTAERMTDWTDAPADWPRTRYEAKAVREGRTPTYLRLRRSPA